MTFLTHIYFLDFAVLWPLQFFYIGFFSSQFSTGLFLLPCFGFLLFGSTTKVIFNIKESGTISLLNL